MNILNEKLLSKKIRFSHHDLLAQKNILSRYKELGESESAISKIEREVDKLTKAKYTINSLLPDYLHLLKRVELTRNHTIVRLFKSRKLKVAMHIIPSCYSIPAHTHPETINAIHVLQGELRLKQYSLLTDHEQHCLIAKKEETCIGLCKLRNIHKIYSLAKPSIYISLRFSTKSPTSFKKVLSVLTSSLILLSPAFLTTPSMAEDKKNSFPNSYQSLINNNLTLANKLRRGNKSYNDLYNAAQLYKKEASKGNAEAQYWLGVMYLDGAGITDDYSEALRWRWIGMSSDQNYPKAQKLLNHMLETEETLDC